MTSSVEQKKTVIDPVICKKFSQALGLAERVVVVSHLAPDFDAVSSVLLLSGILNEQFPEKRVIAVLEDAPFGMDELAGIETLVCKPLGEVLAAEKPDCIVVVDANNWRRVTHDEGVAARQYIEEYTPTTVVIDHHEVHGDSFDVAVQEPQIPAATQLVYELCVRNMGWQLSSPLGLLAMIGIVADSGTFSYGDYDYHQTFEIVQELSDRGVTVGQARAVIDRYTSDQLATVAELLRHLEQKSNYILTYIADETVELWRSRAMTSAQIKSGCAIFANNYLSNIIDTNFGVVVFPSPSLELGVYYASFRAQPNTVDVSVMARALGSGGGHKTAAGVSFKARSIDEARALVEQTIHESHVSEKT